MKKFFAAPLGAACLASLLCGFSFSEDIQTPQYTSSDSTQLIAQIPALDVNDLKEFKKQCYIQLTPIKGCPIEKMVIINSCICDVVFDYKDYDISYRGTIHPRESLLDTRRMTKIKGKQKSFSLKSSKGATYQGLITDYTCDAVVVTWTNGKERYAIVSWSRPTDAELIDLARRLAKTDMP